LKQIFRAIDHPFEEGCYLSAHEICDPVLASPSSLFEASAYSLNTHGDLFLNGCQIRSVP
jgi:hypothetical protein